MAEQIVLSPLRGITGRTMPSLVTTESILNRSGVTPAVTLSPESIATSRSSTTSIVIKDRVIDKSAIPYMRTRTVTYTANGLRPGIIMSATFDGVVVAISSATVAADGSLSGTFDIPTGIPTGSKIFELYDATSSSTGCSAQYTATGQLVTKQRTITSIRNVTETRRTIPSRRPPVTQPVNIVRRNRRPRWSDPIAQSFLVTTEGGAYITSVDIYFKTKDTTLPVSLYLVEMENGGPTSNILPFSQVTVAAGAVNTSADGSLLTKFTFSDPVYTEESAEYAFVLRTDSENYEAWISTLGSVDVASGVGIARQPYLGTLFKSQNSTTWTPDQLSDIKFTINKALFSTSGSTVLKNNNAASLAATDLNFHISEMKLPNTIIDWKYNHTSITGDTAFTPFENNDFDESHVIPTAETLTVTATCSTSNTNVSPVIDKARTSVFSKLNTITGAGPIFNAGTYISQTVNLINQSDDIKILVEAIKPEGADINCFIKTQSYIPTYQQFGQNAAGSSTIGNDIARNELIGKTVTIYQRNSAGDLLTNVGQCIITGFDGVKVYFKSATDITIFGSTSATIEVLVTDDSTLGGVTCPQWLIGSTYAQFDVVFDSVTGKIWESNISSNTGSQPSNVNSDWKEVISVSMGGLADYTSDTELDWQPMELETQAVNDLDASKQFIEYAFKPSRVINADFDSFSIKIDLTSANAHSVPTVKSLRAIAVY